MKTDFKADVRPLKNLLQGIRNLLQNNLEDTPLFLSYNTLLEIHSYLHKYRDFFERKLGCYSFLSYPNDAQTLSQIYEWELLKQSYIRIYTSKIEKVRIIIKQIEGLICIYNEVYTVPKQLLSAIRHFLSEYFHIINRIKT